MTCSQFRPFIVDLARGAIDAAAVEADVERHVRGCDDCRRLLERERIMSAALRRVAQVDVPDVDPERERALLAAFDAAVATTNNRPRYRVWLPATAAVVLLATAVAWKFALGAGTTARRHGADPEAASSAPAITHGAARVDAPSNPDGASESSPREHVARQSASVIPPSGERTLQTQRRRQANQVVDEVRDAAFEQASFIAWPYAGAAPPLESGTVRRVDLPVSILPALGLWPPSSADATVPVEILVGQDGFARAFRLVEP